MPFADHDDYLTQVERPEDRAALSDLRARVRALYPDLVEAIAYDMPAFREPGPRGKAVGGYAAFKSHLSWFPHSGQVLAALGTALAGYAAEKGTLRLTEATVPDDALLRLLIDTRRAEIAASARR